MERIAREKYSSFVCPFSADEKSFIMLTPGVCIIKLIMAVINSATQKASVFVKASKKLLTISKALAYYTMELIMAIKSFMMHAPGAYPREGHVEGVPLMWAWALNCNH